MRIWTVHVKHGRGLELVREGFAWSAFLFPAAWFVINRMWLVLALYVGINLLAVVALAPLPESLMAVIGFGVQLLIGFHARDLRRWTLAHRGYREIGVVASRGDEDEAIARLFAARPDLVVWNVARA